MNGFRWGSLWVLGLVWLAVGVGCADSAESDAKQEKVEKYTGPMILSEEIDPVENPLSEQPGAVEIPLSQISSMLMSGMLQIGYDKHGLVDVEFEQGCMPLLKEIGQALQLSSPRKENAPLGFAVVGISIDLEAVRQMHAVLVEKQLPRQFFQAGREITLVFFSYQSNPHTQLHRVDRLGNRVEIRYRFVRSEGRGAKSTDHFALISLGKLEAGKYRVNVVKSALERQIFGPDFIPNDPFQEKMARELKDRVYKPISREDARKMVCNSFSFTVEEKFAVE